MTQTEQSDSHRREIARIDLGIGTQDNRYHLRVDSDCGVVKLYSSRDGCIIALNSYRARVVADELCKALHEAAESVDRASTGGRR